MKTDQEPEPAGFLQNLPGAVSKLKNRLQRDYEQAYPGLRDLIRIILDEEEAKAWNLSSFPHLFLPDLVEAHIAQLGLQPVKYETLFRPARIAAGQNNQLTPAYVDC
jgi:hypothetical protein